MALLSREIFREKTSSAPPMKLHKNLTRSPEFLYKTAMPHVLDVQNVNDVKGVGEITRIYFAEEEHTFKLVKLEKINQAKMKCVYSVIGGSNFDVEKTVKITYKIKLVAGFGGGSTANISIKHYFKRLGDYSDLSESELDKQAQIQGFDVFGDIKSFTEE